MATRKFLLNLGQNNCINYEFWWCSLSLLCSWVGKRQKEAIAETAWVYEDIVDETPVPSPARSRDLRHPPMFFH
jgi:hypothetical protein